MYGMNHPKPEHGLAVLVNDVSRLMRKQFDLRARKLGLTRAQWRVLANLRRLEGVNQRALAEILEIENITLGRHIDRLESVGLVERRRDESDRRAWRLYLDKKARPIIDRLNAIQAETHEQALAGIAQTDVTALLDCLQRIKGNLTGQDSGDADESVSGDAA